MYGWLWQHLPGRWPTKLASSAVLVLGVLALLFLVAFPYAEDHLPFTNVTVDSPGPTTTPSVPGP